MKSAWKNIEPAFEPMFDEEISISGKRTDVDINTSLKCIVFSDMTGEAFSDNSVNTEREDITISVQPDSFGYVQKLKRGDSIFRSFNNKQYKIQEVKNDVALGWIIKAREV